MIAQGVSPLKRIASVGPEVIRSDAIFADDRWTYLIGYEHLYKATLPFLTALKYRERSYIGFVSPHWGLHVDISWVISVGTGQSLLDDLGLCLV